MTYFHEASLIDSTDDIQFKVYSNTHPKEFIIAKPKYIPSNLMNLIGLKKRFVPVSMEKLHIIETRWELFYVLLGNVFPTVVITK